MIVKLHLIALVLVVIAVALPSCSGADYAGPDETQLNALDPEERILLAVTSGDIDTLQKSLQELPELPTSYSTTGNTLLHHAVMVSQEKSVKFLLDNGADPNALNANNDTPLDVAREMGASSEVTKLLREAGAH